METTAVRVTKYVSSAAPATPRIAGPAHPDAHGGHPAGPGFASGISPCQPLRPAGTVTVTSAGPVRSGSASPVSWARELRHRSQAARAQARALTDHARQLRLNLGQVPVLPVARDELLRHSPYARLLARLETMPIIEQAKGIIMAQTRCEAAEAFDLLRRASQRSNVPVRELAADIVRHSADQPGTGKY